MTTDRFGRAVDSQRSKVYRWEQNLIRSEFQRITDNNEVRRYVRQVAEFHNIRVPAVRFSTRAKRTAHYNPMKHEIMLQANNDGWSRNLAVILHEMSHAVICEKEVSFPENTTAHHGPEFVAIFISTLVKFGLNLCPNKLVDGARSKRVRVAVELVADYQMPEVGKKPTKVSKPAGLIKRPGENTTSGLIWFACDQHADRATIMKACTELGIHPSTASTQYARWKRFQNQ